MPQPDRDTMHRDGTDIFEFAGGQWRWFQHEYEDHAADNWYVMTGIADGPDRETITC